MMHCSEHAKRRSAQRSIAPDDVDLVTRFGAEVFQPGGKVAWHLGRREWEAARRRGHLLPESTCGVAVVLADNGTVITVIRTKDRSQLERFGRPAGRRRH